jgi:nucleoside-diphosphate kinase
MIQQTLVLLKHDAVSRGFIGEIISRFEKVGLKIVAMKMLHPEEDFTKQHYPKSIEERHGKEIYSRIVNYLTMGPVIAFILEGINSIEIVRKMVGETYPDRSLPGTIRGDFAHINKIYANEKNMALFNLIHASENKEDADKEINLWFKQEELVTYEHSHDKLTK